MEAMMRGLGTTFGAATATAFALATVPAAAQMAEDDARIHRWVRDDNPAFLAPSQN
jgi:hypothetical protein